MSSETWLWIIAIAAFVFHFVGDGSYHRKLHQKALRTIVEMLIKIAKGQVLNGQDLNTLRELEKTLPAEEE